MNPQVCIVEVTSLASTGAGAILGLVVAVLLLAVAGASLLVLSRSRASRAAIGLLTVLMILGFGVLWPHASTPALAAPEVSYNGCTLIEVDEASIVLEAVATASLLPGDGTAALTAEVENRFAGTIELSGEALLGSGPLAAELETAVLFDGVVGPVVLLEGDRVTVTVTVALPLGTTNALQGETITVDLVLTAVEQ